MKLFFTPRARRRIIVVASWWRANRPAVPNLFEDELERAKRRLQEQPDIGQPYEADGGEVIHRLLLPKSEQHIYYSVDKASDLITVYTVWGARRGRGPRL